MCPHRNESLELGGKDWAEMDLGDIYRDRLSNNPNKFTQLRDSISLEVVYLKPRCITLIPFIKCS